MRRAIPILIAAALAGPPVAAALSRPVVFLQGAHGSGAVVGEDVLLTQADPAAPSTEFGSALAFGDVDGDGHVDAIVGQRAGNRVYVYLGAGTPAGAAWYTDPNAADLVLAAPVGGTSRIEQFGFSVAAADLDRDGDDDLIIGAPFSDPGGLADAGRAFVVLGGPGLALAGSVDVTAPPPGVVVTELMRGAAAAAGDKLGFAVGAGRLSGAGDTFLVVTARDADAVVGGALGDAGSVHVVFGSSLSPSGGSFDLTSFSAATFFGSDASDAFGEAVATCDIDGDDEDDLLVGAIFGDGPANTGLNRGEVSVFLGGNLVSGYHAGPVSASGAAMTIHGRADGDDLGFSVACGDLNGDGKDDIVAGAVFADSIGAARPSAGEVYVLRGRASDVDPANPLRRRLLDPATGQPQTPVDLSVDTDPADPAPDGADLALLGATTADQLGFSVEVADVDGNGMGDLAAGARRYDEDPSLANVGAVYLQLGSAGFFPGPSGPPRGIDLHAGTVRAVDPGYVPGTPVDHLPDRIDAIVIGAGKDDHAGWSLSSGDLDGDGAEELMLSAIGDLTREPGYPGEAYIISLADRDGDGAGDLVDLDNDNDGLTDQEEIDGSLNGGIPTDPFDPDSDADGIQDGTELGLTCPGGGGVVEIPCDDPSRPLTSTDPAVALHFRPDADPQTVTDPLDDDSDDDGLADGSEDLDGDGSVVAGETDPSLPDTDADGLFDGTEAGVVTPLADTDIPAGHFVADADAGATKTDPADPDTDGDGLEDGIEDANRDGAVLPGGETNPNDPDTDRDGLEDGVEDADHDGMVDAGEPDPLDQDSDDDGLPDGWIDGANGQPIDGVRQVLEGEDLDGDGVFGAIDAESSPIDSDTDGDALYDGLEAGLPAGGGVAGRDGVPDGGPGGDGTDTTAPSFAPDGDAGVTTTTPWDADTDDDGLPDGFIDGYNTNTAPAPGGAVDGMATAYEGEDIDLDGVVDAGETNPGFTDTDGDGLYDGLERGVASPGVLGRDGTQDGSPGMGVQDGTAALPTPEFDMDEATLTDPLDGDSDEDGLSESQEDLNDNGKVDMGESDPNDADTDGDLLLDGTEAGLTAAQPDTDIAAGMFRPDADGGATKTDPSNPDTDGGGATDGAEDADLNGQVDTGERDPLDPADDDRSGVLEFTDTLNGAARTAPLVAGDPVFLRLDDDTDENTDPATAETVPASCVSTGSGGETEAVTLTAVDVDSGVFAGSIPTAASSGASDGTLTVVSGADVTCTYVDAQDPYDVPDRDGRRRSGRATDTGAAARDAPGGSGRLVRARLRPGTRRAHRRSVSWIASDTAGDGCLYSGAGGLHGERWRRR